MRFIRTICFLLLFTVESWGQSAGKVEMADLLRESGKIYTVVAAVVIILTATIILLIRVDRKIFNLEKRMGKDKK